jgi:hypothetical protein
MVTRVAVGTESGGIETYTTLVSPTADALVCALETPTGALTGCETMRGEGRTPAGAFGPTLFVHDAIPMAASTKMFSAADNL